MDRTQYSKTFKTQSGRNYLSVIYYPDIPIKESDEYIISNETTMLDSLAERYYNDYSLWWIIYKANNLSRGAISVPPGMQIRIPTEITSILQEFRDINQ